MIVANIGRVWLLAAAVAAAPAAAAPLSGNPVADGWTARGNSHQTGVYVRDNNEAGALNYDFDIYRRDGVQTVAHGSFLAGDRTIGLGGVCNGDIAGTTNNNCAINALTKFGSPTATFAAASAYDAADGQGDSVFGGPGYILVRIQLGGATAVVNRWNGTAFSPIGDFSGFLQFAAITEAGQYLNSSNVSVATTRIRSWQALLDIDAMARLGFTDIPTQQAVGEVVMQGQRPGRFHFVDALAPTTLAAVPEPASWALMMGGFAMVGAAARRRRVVAA